MAEMTGKGKGEWLVVEMARCTVVRRDYLKENMMERWLDYSSVKTRAAQ
jgi:hypothetical protein